MQHCFGGSRTLIIKVSAKKNKAVANGFSQAQRSTALICDFDGTLFIMPAVLP